MAIARSLYREPDLLILDEATSDLDQATEADLLATLRGLGRSLTTVIVSHRLAPIQAADRVVLLNDGRVTASGTYEELIQEVGEFRQMLGL